MNDRQKRTEELMPLSHRKEGDAHRSSYKHKNIVYDVLSHPAQVGPLIDDILFDIAVRKLKDKKIQQRRSA